MANSDGHRRFGNVRQLPSGRWQIRYPGPDGRTRTGTETYATKTVAERALVLVEGQLVRGDWVDPERAKVKLSDYGDRWIAQRPGLRPRTVQLYRYLFARHIGPYLGNAPLGKLSTALIREWRAELLEKGVSQTVTAKAYRLLRAILMTAVNEDHILPRNPCRVPGADKEDPEERPVLTLPEVFKLADLMPERFRVLLLVVTFASLRYGELVALERCDIDTDTGTIRVRQAFNELRGQGMVLGPPKSRAGRRTVSVPTMILPELREHLAKYVGDEPSALVFTGPKNAPIRRGNFNKLVKWHEAVAKIGKVGLHLHDLRHTGNTLAAGTGASTRDLMARMGHDSMNAAIIYQHATRDADKAIAQALDAKVKAEQDKRAEQDEATKPPSGRTKRTKRTARTNDTPKTTKGTGQADRAKPKPARTEPAKPPAFGPLFLAASDERDEPDDGAAGALVSAG